MVQPRGSQGVCAPPRVATGTKGLDTALLGLGTWFMVVLMRATSRLRDTEQNRTFFFGQRLLPQTLSTSFGFS